MATAKSNHTVQINEDKPKKLIDLKIQCPGVFQYRHCQKISTYWLCSHCNARLQYDYDRHFYCDCGKALVTTYEFLCGSAAHNNQFYKFENLERFRAVLSGLLKEINILVLGETGVGKSTWINGIVNYLGHSSFENACKDGLKYVIPVSFHLHDDNFEEIHITAGEDSNENFDAGASATQYPRTYVLQYDQNTIVRLIDTPGVGDVRGVDQDRINFQNTMNHIRYVDKLHGICILMKPDNARLNILFEFCVKELLTHLHKNARNNIVYCFTNARGTLYRPGHTLTALKALYRERNMPDLLQSISKETVFCFDNECVQFLATLKENTIQYTEAQIRGFSESWNTSVEETWRLFNVIQEFKPHNSMETTSMNDARKLIMELTKPLGDISQDIQQNISLIDQKSQELKHIDDTCDDLRTRLMIKSTIYKTTPLEYPQTVCASEKCSTIQSGKGQLVKNYHMQVCCFDCIIPGIESNTVNSVKLQQCGCMNMELTGDCEKCGCCWNVHMHTTYSSKQIEVETMDPKILQQLDDTRGKKFAIQSTIDTLKENRDQLQEEQEEVTAISAKFAAFLKHNAITAYNDVLEDYLLMFIDKEESKPLDFRNGQVLDGLKNNLKAYQKEKEILDNAMSRSAEGSSLSPLQIVAQANRLCQLKLSGWKIGKMLLAAKEGNQNAAAHFEMFVTPFVATSGYLSPGHDIASAKDAGVIETEGAISLGQFDSNN